MAWLPILYLMLAMPIPDMLYVRIALPLQNFAAQGATSFLAALRRRNDRDGQSAGRGEPVGAPSTR